jgi:hypothetical protein
MSPFCLWLLRGRLTPMVLKNELQQNDRQNHPVCPDNLVLARPL